MNKKDEEKNVKADRSRTHFEIQISIVQTLYEYPFQMIDMTDMRGI